METPIETYKRISNNFPGIHSVELTPITPTITEWDKRNGFITRYFAKRLPRSSDIYEISESQYSLVKNNPSYQALQLIWIIRGAVESSVKPLTSIGGTTNLKGVAEKNAAIVELYEQKLPGLKRLLANPLEFYISY